MIGLEYACNVRGISLSQLAEQINVSRMTVNDWTKKRKSIPEARLKIISGYFQLPISLISKELNNDDKVFCLTEEIKRLSKGGNENAGA